MKEVFYGANNQSHFPVFFPVSFPPLYRGRGNRGKARKLPFRDISGIAGKETAFSFGTEKNRPGGFWGLTLEGDFPPYQNADIAGKEQEK